MLEHRGINIMGRLLGPIHKPVISRESFEARRAKKDEREIFKCIVPCMEDFSPFRYTAWIRNDIF